MKGLELDDIRAVYDRDQRQSLAIPGMRREVLDEVVRQVDLHGNHSAIVYSQLSVENADAVIARERDYFKEMGHHLEWKTYSYDTPDDLPDRLVAHGFEPDGEEAILILDLHNLPDGLQQQSDADIRKITDAEAVNRILNAVSNPVFEMDADNWINEQITQVVRDHPTQISVYAAFADDRPVSAAWINYNAGSVFGGLFGGATLAAYRGRGLYTALIASRAAEAIERGCRYLTVDASPMSRPILEKRGFQLLAMSIPFKSAL